MATEFDAIYKVLVLGDSNVGKTCIVHRFCDERYYDTYISTIGVDFKQKIIQVNGIPIKMQIWDTAGQERFRTLTTAYYRGAMGILLMYDITNTESFNNLGYWLKNIKENASQDVVRILAGNKCEDAAHRTVKTEDGLKIANDFNIPFYEVSCKENINVDQVFLTLAQEIKKQRESRKCMPNSPNIKKNHTLWILNFIALGSLFTCIGTFSWGILNVYDEIDTCNLNPSKTNLPLPSWKNCDSC